MEGQSSGIAAYDGSECWTAFIEERSSAFKLATEAMARDAAQPHVK
jgi:hypothetical protein